MTFLSFLAALIGCDLFANQSSAMNEEAVNGASWDHRDFLSIFPHRLSWHPDHNENEGCDNMEEDEQAGIVGFQDRTNEAGEQANTVQAARLSATAESFFQEELERHGWKGKSQVIMAGKRDKKSFLAAPREHKTTLVREVCLHLASKWARHVKITALAAFVSAANGSCHEDHLGNHICMLAWDASIGHTQGFISHARAGHVSFPNPKDRNVNMMSFVLETRNNDSLPEDPPCLPPSFHWAMTPHDLINDVGCLTVHERHIDTGKTTQRRSGSHIESPGLFSDDTVAATAAFNPGGEEFSWGGGWDLSPPWCMPEASLWLCL